MLESKIRIFLDQNNFLLGQMVSRSKASSGLKLARICCEIEELKFWESSDLRNNWQGTG